MSDNTPCAYCEAHPDQFDEYLIGWLDEADQESFEAHLAGCESCQHALALHREEEALLGSLFSDGSTDGLLNGALASVSEEEHEALLAHVFAQTEQEQEALVGSEVSSEPSDQTQLQNPGLWQVMRRWLSDLPYVLIPATVTACLFMLVLPAEQHTPLLSRKPPVLSQAPTQRASVSKSSQRSKPRIARKPRAMMLMPQVVFGKPTVSSQRTTTLSFASMTLEVQSHSPGPVSVGEEPLVVRTPVPKEAPPAPLESELEVLAVRGGSLVKAAAVPQPGQRELAAMTPTTHHMVALAMTLQKAKVPAQIALVERAGRFIAPHLTL